MTESEATKTEAGRELLALGFQWTDTGGGLCQWICSDGAKGGYCIMTDLEGEAPRELDEPVTLGVYDSSHTLRETEHYPSLRVAIRVNFGETAGEFGVTDDDGRSFGPIVEH